VETVQGLGCWDVFIYFGVRAGWSLRLFGFQGADLVAFGGAGKGRGRVRPDQVIPHFFQVMEQSWKALL
jgi:hypothetical protein